MQSNTLLLLNLAWSEAVFQQEGAMTDDQFVSYANEVLFGEGSEGIYEQISECQGEINMFGDSGPGSMLRLRESIAEWNKIANRLETITGQAIRHRPRLPVYPYRYEPEPYDAF